MRKSHKTPFILSSILHAKFTIAFLAVFGTARRSIQDPSTRSLRSLAQDDRGDMFRPLGLTEEWSVLDRDDRGDATNTRLCHPEFVVTRLCCQHFAKWQNARLAKGLLLFPKISLRCDFREACFMSRAVERVSENVKCKVESVEFWIGQKAFYISSSILHSTFTILH